MILNKERDMHIEPSLVTGLKFVLSYFKTEGTLTGGIKLTLEALRQWGAIYLTERVILATLIAVTVFEILTHFLIRMSEVYFILGSALLFFGVAPAAFGLAARLLTQRLFFVLISLPQYFMHLTSLLIPLFVLSVIAKTVITPKTASVELSNCLALLLSTSDQAAIVGWVAFWAFYSQGFDAEAAASIGLFSIVYITQISWKPSVISRSW